MAENSLDLMKEIPDLGLSLNILPQASQKRVECVACLNHISNVDRLTEVTTNQAAILKEQQDTIQTLVADNQAIRQLLAEKEAIIEQLTMLAGGHDAPGPSRDSNTPVRMVYNGTGAPADIIPRMEPVVVQPPAARRARPPRRLSPSDMETPSKRKGKKMKKGKRLGRPKKASSKGIAKPKMQRHNGSKASSSASLPIAYHVNDGSNHLGNSADDDDEETVEVTRIWITGTPNPRTRCPLPMCANRDFSAADMYHFKRHFQQVHKHTHPNPEFILQCPVEDCSVECENSLKEMKDHMRHEHPYLFTDQKLPPLSKKGSRKKGKTAHKNNNVFVYNTAEYGGS